jgi:hypothetical protein
MRLSAADERLHGAFRQSAHLSGVRRKARGLNPEKRYPSSGGALDPPDRGNFRLLDRPSWDSWSRLVGPFELCPRRVPALDYASAVGAGSGSDCGAATPERRRLGLDLAGAEAASLSTFALDLDRVVRFGLGLASTSLSRLTAANSAVGGSEAASVFRLRPRPSCFASADRCSEYAGAVRG